MIALGIVFMRVYYGYIGQCLFLRVYYTPCFKPSGPITVTISYSKIRDWHKLVSRYFPPFIQKNSEIIKFQTLYVLWIEYCIRCPACPTSGVATKVINSGVFFTKQGVSLSPLRLLASNTGLYYVELFSGGHSAVTLNSLCLKFNTQRLLPFRYHWWLNCIWNCCLRIKFPELAVTSTTCDKLLPFCAQDSWL